MTTPILLKTKPTASDEVRAAAVAVLEEALDLARGGQISNVVIILSHIDGCWQDKCSRTNSFAQDIGRLEIIKQKWIKQYLEES